MPPRPAIVATVRDVADVLGSFIAWHLASGFAHIYLFFDDPAEAGAAQLHGHPQVSAIPCDGALRERWRTLRSWPAYGGHVASEVMARQILNCELAIGMAAAAGFDWILHIDADELFLSEGASAPEHFAALDFRGAGNAVYMNFEALPERLEIGDYFREVTLFKVNVQRLGAPRFSPEQLALIRRSRFTDPHFNFHLYSNGKAAARVGPDLVPSTVHGFARLRADGSRDTRHEICGDSQLILHYPNCGLSRFLAKYRVLGAFADKWFGAAEVFPFHREARDVVLRGDPAEAERFYRERVMLHEAEDVDTLIRNGALRRITGPATLLARLGATAA